MTANLDAIRARLDELDSARAAAIAFDSFNGDPAEDMRRSKAWDRAQDAVCANPEDVQRALLDALDKRDAKLALYQRPEGTYISEWGADTITRQAAELQTAQERIKELEAALSLHTGDIRDEYLSDDKALRCRFCGDHLPSHTSGCKTVHARKALRGE